MHSHAVIEVEAAGCKGRILKCCVFGKLLSQLSLCSDNFLKKFRTVFRNIELLKIELQNMEVQNDAQDFSTFFLIPKL